MRLGAVAGVPAPRDGECPPRPTSPGAHPHAAVLAGAPAARRVRRAERDHHLVAGQPARSAREASAGRAERVRQQQGCATGVAAWSGSPGRGPAPPCRPPGAVTARPNLDEATQEPLGSHQGAHGPRGRRVPAVHRVRGRWRATTPNARRSRGWAPGRPGCSGTAHRAGERHLAARRRPHPVSPAARPTARAWQAATASTCLRCGGAGRRARARARARPPGVPAVRSRAGLDGPGLVVPLPSMGLGAPARGRPERRGARRTGARGAASRPSARAGRALRRLPGRGRGRPAHRGDRPGPGRARHRPPRRHLAADAGPVGPDGDARAGTRGDRPGAPVRPDRRGQHAPRHGRGAAPPHRPRAARAGRPGRGRARRARPDRAGRLVRHAGRASTSPRSPGPATWSR